MAGASRIWKFVKIFCRTKLTEVSGTGMKVCTFTGGTSIHIVPNLPKCRTEFTEVSGTGIDVAGTGTGTGPDLGTYTGGI